MTIPISALQRNAAEVVHRVSASGVSELITHRGRVVAVLAPPPVAGGLEGLREAGLSRRGDPQALARAIEAAGTLPAIGLSEALAEQRDSER